MRLRFAVLLASVLVVVVAVAAVVWALTGPSGDAGLDRSDSAGAPIVADDDFGSVEVYRVAQDGSLDPSATGLTAHVWEVFTRVVTPDFAAETMAEFRVGDDADSDTLAYVYQDADPERWVLAANLATSGEDADLVATLVHEFAHILSLSVEEVDPRSGSCETVELDEGCAYPDAALVSFIDEFWSGYDDAPDVGNADADLAWEFYLEHEEDFVSDYAATNAVEDFAESFAAFVLEDVPDADTVVARKLAFFADYPEFEAIRERLRAEFADELGLAG